MIEVNAFNLATSCEQEEEWGGGVSTRSKQRRGASVRKSVWVLRAYLAIDTLCKLLQYNSRCSLRLESEQGNLHTQGWGVYFREPRS